MASRVRAIATTGKLPSASRAIQPITLGSIHIGVKWRYKIIKALTGNERQRSSIYIAEMLPRDAITGSFRRTIIKTAAAHDEVSKQNLKREIDVYLHNNVSSSSSFRAMYDILDDPEISNNTSDTAFPCLALEGLDTTMADVSCTLDRRSYILITTIIKTVATSCAVLAQDGLVNTDIKPDNVLISGVETDHPVVKMADLGLGKHTLHKLRRTCTGALVVFRDGSRISAQPHAMRAPEVWQGYPCTDASQVWALAAMLLCWIKPGILGLAGNRDLLPRESLCLTKLLRLFPAWQVPFVENHIRQLEFNFAKALVEEPPPEIEKIDSLENELDKAGVLPELKHFLCSLLIIDPRKRPLAAQVLESKEYRSLETAVAGMK